jgi:poly(A)-specific ribonuclease
LTLSQPKKQDYLNIAPEHFKVDPNSLRGLSKFQKLLVHQLVRAEFPSLRTISRDTFIQIIAFDKQREDANKQRQQKRLEEQISRQIGLRWVFEAMSGGDLSGMNPREFGRTLGGEAKFVDMEAINKRFETVRERLQRKRTVLVGHNLFTDLIYLYRVFLGKLPDKIEDFRHVIHDLFPL